MAEEMVFTMAGYEEGCGCCVTDAEQRDADGNDYGCEHRSRVFTSREEVVLKRILDNRARAEAVKKRIREIIARNANGSTELPPAEARALEQAREDLDALRRERAELETERLDAADERMRLLGHL